MARPISLPVTLVEQLGDETIAYLATAGGQALVVKLPGQQTLALGERLALRVAAADCHLFGADGKALTIAAGPDALVHSL